MPTGVIVNSLSIAVGGVIGAIVGKRLNGGFKDKMNMVFGACAMTMGVFSIILIQNLPAVILTVILGTAIGSICRFNDGIIFLSGKMQAVISRFVKRDDSLSQEEFDATLLTIIVLFCASGTGIYGSLVEGMSGESTILISKSILDLFTALIFACTLGAVVSFIAVPQFIIFFLLYLMGGFLFPFTTSAMINDFKAVGGVLLLATGFRMLRLKMFPTADMIPAMIIAMPLSWLWTQYVAPLL